MLVLSRLSKTVETMWPCNPLISLTEDSTETENVTYNFIVKYKYNLHELMQMVLLNHTYQLARSKNNFVQHTVELIESIRCVADIRYKF